VHDGSAVVSAGVPVPVALFKPWAGHPGVLTADVSSLDLDFGTMGTGGSSHGLSNHSYAA
jgi:hypothetical protein